MYTKYKLKGFQTRNPFNYNINKWQQFRDYLNFFKFKKQNVKKSLKLINKNKFNLINNKKLVKNNNKLSVVKRTRFQLIKSDFNFNKFNNNSIDFSQNVNKNQNSFQRNLFSNRIQNKNKYFSKNQLNNSRKTSSVVIIGGIAYKLTKNKQKLIKKISEKPLVRREDKKAIHLPPRKTSIKGNTKMLSNILTENKTINNNNNINNNFKTLIVRGIKYEMDLKAKTLRQVVSNTTETPKNGKRMSRLDIGGLTYRSTKPGLFTANTASQRVRRFRNRAIKSSINRILSAKKSVNVNKKHCIFFCRFGRCNKGDDCPYIHDSNKIAVCSRFIRGTCKSKDCPFSHCVAPDKMPVCQFYLEGRCNSDSCPYRHVKVSADADICQAFNRGYCPNGEKCKNSHLFVRKKVKKLKPKPQSLSIVPNLNSSDSQFQSKTESLPQFIAISKSENCYSDPKPIFLANECQQNSCDSVETVVNNINNNNNNLNNNKINRKQKYFWLESDDENSDSNDSVVNEEAVCRPTIRIVPKFLL